MKTLWNALSIVAIANLLALGGFVGWLAASDRLDMARVREVRERLTETRAAEAERKAADQAKVEEEQRAAEAAAKAARPPMSATERVSARLEATQLDHERAARLRREVQDLQRMLAEERAILDEREAKIAARELAFQQAAAKDRALAADDQFQRALSVLTALKPQQAVGVLMELISGQPQAPAADFAPVGSTPQANAAVDLATPAAVKDESGIEKAVTYLNAMDERPRAKVMAEFVKVDPRLAAELLERMRTRTQFAGVSSS